MKISILTLFPNLYTEFLETSLVKRARDRELVFTDLCNLFEFCAPKQRIDSTTFGPGSGMLIRPDVVEQGIKKQEAKHGKAFKIFFSPQGKKLDQGLLRKIYEQVQDKHLLMFASRYEGIDARVEEEYADLSVSVGDFVLMGGDLPAMTLLEGLMRFVPNVIGEAASVEADSFTGPYIDYPEYAQPVDWNGRIVPEIVRSGNHQAIADWRHEQAVKKTVLEHFEWLRSHRLSQSEIQESKKFIPNHYAALLHGDVMLKDQKNPGKLCAGTTSVTSFDLHDVSRSSFTYGLENYFIVTPLKDQKHIVNTLLDFWRSASGIEYNQHRYQAVSRVMLKNNIDEVVAQITKKEGKAPLLVATSAQHTEHAKNITFYDQGEVWQHDRPVLFVFGTGKGLAPYILDRCDYLLEPIYGFSDFNHLSVRAATSIIFDRWLGINPKNRS